MGNGINNHQEFVELVESHIGDYFKQGKSSYKREKVKYTGGEYRA